MRETQAEAAAFTVCKHIGLDTGCAADDYIALYDRDREALIKSLNIIRDTAARLIAALEANAEPEEGAA